MLPPPDSEPTTTLNPFRSKTAPATLAKVRAEFGPTGPPVSVGTAATLFATEPTV